MSRVSSSPLGITALSKQQAHVKSTGGNLNKIKALIQMIDELKKERIEYEKTNQHLMQNTQLIYQQNQKLKDEINSRKVYYEHISDKCSQSTKTLEKEFYRNKKMTQIYSIYQNKASNSQQTNVDTTDWIQKIDKYNKEIHSIEKSATYLIHKFSESEKRAYNYRVLLSLNTRLTNINNLFEKEAKNCFSCPKLIKQSHLKELQQKLSKGNEIKKELLFLNIKEENIKNSAAKQALNNFSIDCDRSFSIYNKILRISKQATLVNDDDFEYLSSDLSSKSSSSRSSINRPSKSNRNEIVDDDENVVSNVPKKFRFKDEIDELRKIIGNESIEYSDDENVSVKEVKKKTEKKLMKENKGEKEKLEQLPNKSYKQRNAKISSEDEKSAEKVKKTENFSEKQRNTEEMKQTVNLPRRENSTKEVKRTENLPRRESNTKDVSVKQTTNLPKRDNNTENIKQTTIFSKRDSNTDNIKQSVNLSRGENGVDEVKQTKKFLFKNNTRIEIQELEQLSEYESSEVVKQANQLPENNANKIKQAEQPSIKDESKIEVTQIEQLSEDENCIEEEEELSDKDDNQDDVDQLDENQPVTIKESQPKGNSVHEKSQKQQVKRKKPVRFRKKMIIKRVSKSKQQQKVVKQDVAVQALNSSTSGKNIQQNETEKTKPLLIDRKDEQPKQEEVNKRKYTIGNEVITEFLLDKFEEESQDEINESKESTNVNEKRSQNQELKPLLGNQTKQKDKIQYKHEIENEIVAELLVEYESEEDDELDKASISEFSTDSYNLESSASMFLEETPQLTDQLPKKHKHAIGNEVITEFLLDEYESDNEINQDENELSKTEQIKQETKTKDNIQSVKTSNSEKFMNSNQSINIKKNESNVNIEQKIEPPARVHFQEGLIKPSSARRSRKSSENLNKAIKTQKFYLPFTSQETNQNQFKTNQSEQIKTKQQEQIKPKLPEQPIPKQSEQIRQKLTEQTKSKQLGQIKLPQKSSDELRPPLVHSDKFMSKFEESYCIDISDEITSYEYLSDEIENEWDKPVKTQKFFLKPQVDLKKESKNTEKQDESKDIFDPKEFTLNSKDKLVSVNLLVDLEEDSEQTELKGHKQSDQIKPKLPEQQKPSEQIRQKLQEQSMTKQSEPIKQKPTEQLKPKQSEQIKPKLPEQQKTSEQIRQKLQEQAKPQTTEQSNSKQSEQPKQKQTEQSKPKQFERSNSKQAEQSKQKQTEPIKPKQFEQPNSKQTEPIKPNSKQTEQIKQKQTEQPKTTQLTNKSSMSLLFNNQQKRSQSQTMLNKQSNDDELSSDYMLDEQESEPDSPKNESKPTTQKETTTTTTTTKPPTPKKPVRKSTYDRSIFYKPMNVLDNESREKVSITVTLKDIGLEGLDSSTPDKALKIRRDMKKMEKDEPLSKMQKNRPTSATVNHYLPVSSESKNLSKTNPKQASLLDSTQKAQKHQAIKPKTAQKKHQKLKKNIKNKDINDRINPMLMLNCLSE